MADVVLPFPVTRLVRSEDVRPEVVKRILARGAAYLSPTDACMAYLDLFPAGAEAAKKALQRSEHGDIPLKIGFNDVPHRAVGTIRVAGPR